MHCFYMSSTFFSTDFINSSADAGLTEQQFIDMVNGLVEDLNMLGWIWDEAEGGRLI